MPSGPGRGRGRGRRRPHVTRRGQGRAGDAPVTQPGRRGYSTPRARKVPGPGGSPGPGEMQDTLGSQLHPARVPPWRPGPRLCRSPPRRGQARARCSRPGGPRAVRCSRLPAAWGSGPQGSAGPSPARRSACGVHLPIKAAPRGRAPPGKARRRDSRRRPCWRTRLGSFLAACRVASKFQGPSYTAVLTWMNPSSPTSGPTAQALRRSACS